MRKYTILVVLILLITILSGCTSKMPYEVIHKDGKTYLLMPDTNSNNSQDGYLQAPWIRFDTLDEMISDINTGNFTEEELDKLSQFPTDDSGCIEVPILSYMPTFPDNYKHYAVIWYSTGVQFRVYLDIEEELIDSIVLIPENEFTHTADRWNRLDEFDDALTATPINDRNAILYTAPATENQKAKKIIWYTIESNGKVLYIREQYDLEISEEAIDSITIYGSENGCCFRIFCDSKVVTTRPSIEWLSQFGMVPYEAE